MLALTQASLNHVVLMSVIESSRVAMRRGAGYQKEEEIKLREKANIRFIDWAERLFEMGMEVGVYISVGSLVQQVVDSAKKEEVDLVVISPPRKGKLEKLYSGSDIAEIIRRTDTPVLACKSRLPEEGRADERPFSRPILATNWSQGSIQAIEYLKHFKPLIEEVDVIHVVHEKDLKGTSAMAVQKTRKEARKKLEAVCDVLEAEGIAAKAHVYIGNTAHEIKKAAQECRSTMILIGASGKASRMGRFVGSVSQAVAEESIIPALLIPSGARE
jgi:nucleotide-binding universal stress UspA family protein